MVGAPELGENREAHHLKQWELLLLEDKTMQVRGRRLRFLRMQYTRRRQ